MNVQSGRTGALLIGLGLLFLLISGCSEESIEDLPQFPDKADVTYVFGEGKDEVNRLLRYWPDGVSIRSEQIDYQNGVTSLLFYRKTGSLERIEELYPIQEGSEERRRKSLVEMADDGSSFVSHFAYRPDGTLARRGERVVAGGYKTVYLAEDGISPTRSLVFDASRAFQKAEEFSKDGTVVRRLMRLSPSRFEHQLMAPDGSVEAVVVDNKYTGLEGKFFHPDGMLKAKLDGHRIGYDVDYYDNQGKQTFFVEFFSNRTVVVTVFDSTEKELYTQFWQPTGKTGWCSAGPYLLNKLKVLNWDGGKTENTQLLFGSSGESVQMIEYSDNGEVLSMRAVDDDQPMPDDLHGIAVSELVARPDFECLPVPERVKWK